MADPTTIQALQQRATALRKHVLSIATAQSAHLGGAMSCADLMAALCFHFLNLEEGKQPRDHFLMSKGHAVHVWHACLAERRLIDASELPKTMQLGSRLAGHPTKRAPGVEFATGSLGHGLSVAVGTALGEQLRRSPARTVVLLGDGELQEGNIWEAALCAPRLGLERLLAIVDYNRFQASNCIDDCVPLDPLADKWRAFRWNVQVVDGHDMAAILSALAAFPAAKGPTVLIAQTIKGKGVPGVEGTLRAHFTQVTEDEARRALASWEVQA
jgi:transketolase